MVVWVKKPETSSVDTLNKGLDLQGKLITDGFGIWTSRKGAEID
jgi:hypothetical protein